MKNKKRTSFKSKKSKKNPLFLGMKSANFLNQLNKQSKRELKRLNNKKLKKKILQKSNKSSLKTKLRNKKMKMEIITIPTLMS